MDTEAIMSMLRKTLLCILAAGAAAPAFAERVTCESHKSDVEACTTVLAGSHVRVVQQLGNTTCVEGQNWGLDSKLNSVWISSGCSGIFEVQPPRDNPDSKRHEPR
jgi:hypothetical protein